MLSVTFDSPKYGEVTITAIWDYDSWCIETAIDNDGNELILDREDEWRGEDALDRRCAKENRP